MALLLMSVNSYVFIKQRSIIVETIGMEIVV